jgi:hypothetical protein
MTPLLYNLAAVTDLLTNKTVRGYRNLLPAAITATILSSRVDRPFAVGSFAKRRITAYCSVLFSRAKKSLAALFWDSASIKSAGGVAFRCETWAASHLPSALASATSARPAARMRPAFVSASTLFTFSLTRHFLDAAERTFADSTIGHTIGAAPKSSPSKVKRRQLHRSSVTEYRTSSLPTSAKRRSAFDSFGVAMNRTLVRR